MRILGLSGLVVAIATGVTLWLSVPWPYPAGLWGWFWPSVTIGLGSGLISVMRLQRRRDVASGFWSRLWGSSAGRWLFELASVGLKRDALKSYTRYLDLYPHAEDKDRIRAYLQAEHPHLLSAYDAGFLIAAIQTAKARCYDAMVACGPHAAPRTDWAAIQSVQVGV